MSGTEALTSLNGYPGQIWREVLNTLDYANTTLTASGQLSSQQLLANACATTFKRARDSLDAYAYVQAWANEYRLLAPILTYSLGLSTADTAYITNRIEAIQSAAIAGASLYSTVFLSVSNLSSGDPIIEDPKLIEFLMNWDYETTPDFTTSPSTWPTDFQTYAQGQATAWANTVTALQTQGVPLGGSLDAAQRQAAFSLNTATMVSNATMSVNADPTTTWNRLISMANACLIGNAYLSDPTSSVSQQNNVARLITMQSLDQFNILIANLDEVVPENVTTVNVRLNDTLPKIAARELGNFELWPALAALNGLIPPYITTSYPPGTGLLSTGQTIFIPTGQVTTTTQYQPINSQISYELDYLGTDIYLGPLSQQEMNTWTGDFEVISGYANLENAIDRRLITPIGSLLFHSNYGSRIPSEIGQVNDATIIGYLGAYAESAVLTDPRIASVDNLSITFPQFGVVNISLDATPNGNNTVTTNSTTSFNASGLS